jgi:predicted MFS family arabinose efflux permease
MIVPGRWLPPLYRRAFSGLPRDVWLVSAIALVNRSGTMVMPFLALYLTRRLGYPPSDAGALVGVYGAGSLIGAYGGGWLADRLGARPVMAWSLVLQGIGFFAIEPLRSTAAIAVAFFAVGLVGEAFRPATSTALMLAAPPEKRPRAFALLRLAVNLGMGIGPTVGGLLAATGYEWLFWIDGATCLGAAILLRFVSFGAMETQPIAPTVRSPWRDGPFLTLVAAQLGVCVIFFQLISSFPLTLAGVFGLSEARIGATIAINASLIALFEMVAVHALERFPALPLCGIGAALVGLGLGATPFAPSYSWVVVAVLIWTVGEVLNLPFVAIVAAQRAGPRMGSYMGLLNLSFSFGFVAAPLLGGWAYERFGPRPLGAALIGLGVLLAPVFFALDRSDRRFRPRTL